MALVAVTQNIVQTSWQELAEVLQPFLDPEGYNIHSLYRDMYRRDLQTGTYAIIIAVESAYDFEGDQEPYSFQEFMDERPLLSHFLAECVSRGWIPKADYVFHS
jgi:hypothetical protein